MDERKRFVPLSVRMGKREPLGQTTGVPDFLWLSVEHWLEQVLERFEYGAEAELTRVACRSLQIPGVTTWRQLVMAAAQDDGELLLDVLDLVVRVTTRQEREKLEDVLFDVAHEYRVDFEHKRLVKRVDDSVYGAYEVAVSVQDAASEHLATAWIAAYGRDKNYDTTVMEATKAVEAVCAQLIIPNDKAPSIGKMIRALLDRPGKWECSLPATHDRGPVEQFAAALALVNYPTSRHGGSGKASREHSVAVLLQAITVVAWVREDVLRRVTD